MATPKLQLVAVDTNVLLRLVDGQEAAIDAWQLIKRRLRPLQFVVSPTVLGELASKAGADPDVRVRKAARKALIELRPRWRFQPVDFNAVDAAIAANAARCLRDSGLLPYEERNDAAIVAEAAVLKCVLLVSRDSHLLDIDHERLSLLLSVSGLARPNYCVPGKAAEKI